MNHLTTHAVIEADRLTKQFGDLTAVSELSLSVCSGEIFGLVGPDGAGKTTTLRMLSSIMDPTSGGARVAGFDVATQPANVKDHLAYMSQRFSLYPDLTVRENISFYADLYGVPRKGREERMDELLDFSNMRPFKKRKAGNLSGGMKQKLQLVCALIHTPRVLLLDEPTNGVDPVSRRDFWRILYRLLEQDVAILVTTAYLDEAERCNRVGLLNQGKLMASGTPQEVKTLMAGDIVAIKSPDTWKITGLIRDNMDCQSVNVFGDTVHVVCNNVEQVMERARDLVESAGFMIDTMRPVQPTLEDVFVSVLGEKRKSDEDEAEKEMMAAGMSRVREDNGETMAVTVSGLTRRFGDFTAVNSISFDVARGEIFGFLGPNGAGKSTTIRMLCGLLEPTEGEGRVGGFDINRQPESIKKNIGYMSQKFSLYEDLTVDENIRFYGGIYGLKGKLMNERRDWAIEMSGLAEHRKNLTRNLSGGIKQRLALACSLLHQPPIIFLDEPTSGVDPLSRRRFWDLIYIMADLGVTVFVTTHYMEEAEYCDRVALIYGGNMIAMGTPRDLKTRRMKETILDLRCESPQSVAADLRNLPRIRDAALFGAGLHLVVDDAAEGERAVRDAFGQMNRSILSLEQVTPGMEDVFISLIEEADRQNGAEETSVEEAT